MMMEETIRNFAEQLKYAPEVENAAVLKHSGLPRHGGGKFVIAGMGGSNLASELLKVWNPELDIIVHRDFGLPAMAESELRNRLVIISSYSGGTEETIDAFREALKKKLSVIVLATGGELLELAKENSAPYIQMPSIGIRPQLAVGLSLKAMLKAIGDDGALEEISELAGSFNAADYEAAGKNLAEKFGEKIPVIYSSNRNSPLAYYWKINFEETSKTPAFCNAFPELNHNEMIGLVSSPAGESLPSKFHFVFLKDKNDDPRMQKRAEATAKLYEVKGLSVENADLEGGIWQKIFGSLSLSNWTSFYLAQDRGVDPEDISVIETFKKQMR
jgi:glucose/mannose-6-phosphate isomerase